MIPFQLHRRIPLVRRPFYQRDSIAAERDALKARLGCVEQQLVALCHNGAVAENPASDAADGIKATVERHWDKAVKELVQVPCNSTWWLAPVVIRHINRVVCGESIDGLHAGFHRLIGRAMADAPRPRRALSVGCGIGTKEMDALAAGVVDTFDCYDVSADAIRAGQEVAVAHGVSEKITFHHGDPFSFEITLNFDLVYWNNALHHMMDTRAAIEWSRDHLRDGGIFAMDDYVGNTRMQHSPELVAWGTRLLGMLPEYLRRHWNGVDVLPAVIGVVPAEDMARVDPSECADSGSILSSVQSIFPNAQIIKTGGAAYAIALCNTIQNYRSETELALLNAILMADEAATDRFETQYAVAIATKQPKH